MSREYSGQLHLASKGIFYDGKIPDGILKVEPWSTKEERLLLSPSLAFEETIDRLISAVTDCPIPPEDLLLADRQHLFFYMRCLSYGGDYEFHFKCEECKEKVSRDFDLEKDLDVVYSDNTDLLEDRSISSMDELTEPFEFTLPLQNKRVEWRMLRGKDERSIERIIQKKSKRSHNKEDESYILRLATRLVSVDDEKFDNIYDAVAFVETIKGKDSLAFRQEIESVNIGIDTEIEIRCKCGFPNELLIPLDKSFFRPRRKAATC